MPRLALILCLLSWPALALDVTAQVLRVKDGDTIVVRAQIWLDTYVETAVRLRGVDTPEIHGKCPEEKALARRATEYVAAALSGRVVRLVNVRRGKYGRAVATVLVDGLDLAREIIAAGLGRAYFGEKRQSWCGEE